MNVSAERGSLLPLVAGLFALTGVFAVSVIDATDLAITRTEIHSIADGAALAAAQHITPATTTLVNGQLTISLSATTARRDVTAFIRESRVTGVTVESVSVPDARTVVVTLSRVWRAPIDSEFLPIRVRVSVTSRARTVIG